MTASSSNSKIIQTLGPYDILCGRGKGAYNNVGNGRFRLTMSMNIENYLACKSKIERTVLVGSIVDNLREEVGARFLKAEDGGSGYIELNENQAREKVAHALRDMAVAQKQTTIKQWTKQERHVDRVAQRQKDILLSLMKDNADEDGAEDEETVAAPTDNTCFNAPDVKMGKS